ncbi:MAG TPA: TIR domain-containing protein, partial [Anaerolineae bacterium]|nr:TIR domain-containing protein [Anaerolineae bacterium]
MAEPVKLFFAYAREDQKLRAELAKHLAPLRRSRLLSDWHDGDITAGSEWAADIDQALHAADIILLLISPDFLASDYCYDNEMTKAVARHDAGQAVVIPIILRPCYWEDAPFGKLQALPKDAKPVSHWPHPDDAFFEITKVVRQTAEQVKAKRQAEAEARAEADRRTQAEAERRAAEKAEAERRAAEKAETERMARAETLLPPPFAWVKIPAGQVTLVTEENWADNYIPKGQSRVFKVEPFAIAKYPLTNAQFKPFLEAGGYRDKQWWTEAGWEAREQGWAWDNKAEKW